MTIKSGISVKFKLRFLMVLLVCTFTTIAYISFSSNNKFSTQITNLGEIQMPAVSNMILADMMHDGIRAVVFKAILISKQQDQAAIKEVKDESQEFTKNINQYISELKKIDLNPNTKKAIEPVLPKLDEYIKSANEIVEIALSGNESAARAALPKFNEKFEALEKELGSLGDLIRKDSSEVTASGNIIKSEANKLNIYSFIIGIFLIIFAIIVLRNQETQFNNDQRNAARLMSDAMRSYNMIETSPINTMMATPDGILTYMNANSKNTYKSLEQYTLVKSENLIGKNIDQFHKNNTIPAKIIKDPKNLPHRVTITLGPEKLDLLVAAIFDGEGKYLGPMVTWEIITSKVDLIDNLSKASDQLAIAAAGVLSISTSLSSAAEQTTAQASTASEASQEVNAGVKNVATNMEQMALAIKEITKTTNEAALLTNNAMKLTQNTNKIINQLGDSSTDIGNVIKVISSIAGQTNLLALNATIEAARAGEAGKGFAVVANEVKELANQTARATSEITKKIETIQNDSKNAMSAIAEISDAIEKVNGFTSNIASSMEEQGATTNEITRIISISATSVDKINENINQVSEAAASTGKDANKAHLAAVGVGKTADKLKDYVSKLKLEDRA